MKASKIPIETGIPLNIRKFRAIFIQLIFKEKISLDTAKVTQNGCWYSKVPLVRLAHLVRNTLKEGPLFLNIKSAGAPLRGHPQAI